MLQIELFLGQCMDDVNNVYEKGTNYLIKYFVDRR